MTSRNLARTLAVACIGACACLAVFGAPAEASTIVHFTGTDGTGTLSGTATVDQEGYNFAPLGFSVTFSNLLADGYSLDTTSFSMTDTPAAYWFTPGNPQGTGQATFTFDAATNASGANAHSCAFNCVQLVAGATTKQFTTSVVSYTEVPEPSGFALLAPGLFALGLARRRTNAAI